MKTKKPSPSFLVKLASSSLKDYLPYGICAAFFLAYAVLSVIKHNHFLSGYDLGVSDQAIWLMSKFKNPISTTHAYAFTSLFHDHVEIIYALISPIYWFFDDSRILIILQAFLITASGIPVYLLAKKKQLNVYLRYAILCSFLLFYGIQNAIWADVHSLVFAASFLPWFIYFLEQKKLLWSFVSFFLLISCKEDIAMFTFLISGIFFIRTRWRPTLILAGLSLLYILLIFGIYFPYFTPEGYRFQNKEGLLSNVQVENFYNTQGKKDVIFYTFAWFGFLPILSPLFLLPIIADMAHYFVLGSDYVTSAQGLFLHYRVTLASLTAVATIYTLTRFKRLNSVYTAGYIIILALFFQYALHLPLSYLAKKWFWTKPYGAQNIEALLLSVPKQTAIVAQNNIVPHVNHREQVFTLWPEKKTFLEDSPCGEAVCDWFHWPGKPEYMIVDTSSDWDARYWLTNREEFIRGVENLEKTKVILLEKQHDTAKIYRVLKNPQD